MKKVVICLGVLVIFALLMIKTARADELSEVMTQLKTLKEQNESARKVIQDLKRKLNRSVQMVENLTDRVDSLEREQQPSKRLKPTAGSQGALSSRVDNLEEQLFEIEEKMGGKGIVHTFEVFDLDLGGFLTQSYTAAFGEASDEYSFNMTQLEILVKANIDEHWSLFTALGFLREADLDFSDPNNPNFASYETRVPLIIGWVNFRAHDSLEIQMGRYVTPHGIINIEHFPPALLDANQPQFLRPFSGNTIFPNFLNGVNIHGKFFSGEHDNNILKYNVFSGSFADGDPEEFISGGRLAYNLGDTGLTFGTNYSYGTRVSGSSRLGHLSVVGKKSLTTNHYNMVGGDILYDQGKLLWKNELFSTSENNQHDRLAFYTQPAWRFNDQWIGFYRYDFLDPGQGVTESNEHMIGINFLPKPYVRLRAIYLLKEFENSGIGDQILHFSGTISF